MTSLETITKSPSVPVLGAAKKAIPMSVPLPALASGISYAAYASDLAVSQWPWRIGLVVTILCLVAPFIVYLCARRTNALWAWGVIAAISVFAVYYFFGVFGYFYYFIFAPMPGWIRLPGLIGGLGITIYWLIITRRRVNYTIENTSFVKKAFLDDESMIYYDTQKGMRIFEKVYKEPQPFPRIYLYLVCGLAPFYLIINRLLAQSFGTNGVLLFIAILGMPMSLWVVGALVRVYLVMIALPRKMERATRKRVVVVA